MSDATLRLPQQDGGLFLTDGGIETVLIFQEGIALPEFAAFVLLESEEGRTSLLRYFRRYLDAGDAAAAVRHAEAAVRLDPEYSAAWKAFGRALTAAGRPTDALAAYERGAKVAERRGDQQAAKEMRVFSKRLQRDAANPQDKNKV